MRETRFQHLIPDNVSVDIKLVNSQSGRHPAHGLDGFAAIKPEHEPAGAVRSPVPVGNPFLNDRSIGNGNPLRAIPAILNRIRQFKSGRPSRAGQYKKRKRSRKGE